MAEPNLQTINAATEAVDAVNTIKELEASLVLPATTQAEQSANATIYASLRDEKTNLNNANSILRKNKVETLNLKNVRLNSEGLVIAPWTFSHDITGTAQYDTVELEDPESITESEIELNIQDANKVIKSLQKQYGVLKTQIRNAREEGENTDKKEAELQELEERILSIENNISSLESAITLKDDPRNQSQILKQQDRKELEDTVRSHRRSVSELSIKVDSLLNVSGKEDELETAIKDLQDAKEILRLNEQRLTQFLNSKDSENTTPSKETQEIDIDFLTEDEEISIRKLQQQIVDRINTAKTEQERLQAFNDLSNLESAVQNENIDRIDLPSPDLTENLDITSELNSLISQRNTLLLQLQETDDETEINSIKVQLEDVNKERQELSLKIIGLQNNIQVNTKMRVIEDPNSPGNYLLESFNTSNGHYRVDDVYDLLLSENLEADKTTKGFLDSKQYEQLRLATATQVFDMEKGRIIPRKDAQTGQEDRYINIRPNIENLEEFLGNGQAEIEILQSLLATSDEAEAYQKALSELLEPFLEKNEELNNKINDKRNEIRDTLGSIGVSKTEIDRLAPLDPNIELNSEEIYLAISTSKYARDEDT